MNYQNTEQESFFINVTDTKQRSANHESETPVLPGISDVDAQPIQLNLPIELIKQLRKRDI